jgi:hypothetical protein
VFQLASSIQFFEHNFVGISYFSLRATYPAYTCNFISKLINNNQHMLTRVWQELEYRIDVCRVPPGAHIERL